METKTTHQASMAKKLKPTKPSTNLTDLDIDDEEKSQQVGSGNQSGNVVLLRPDSSLSPEEKVFSIDHVFETIFHELDKTSLLNSRLVSGRWAYFATKALQDQVTISFDGLFKLNSSRNNFVFSFETNKGRPVQDLVDLMNNSLEFPSTSFCFSNGSYESATSDLEPFFRLHAWQIESLKLKGIFSSKDFTHVILTRALNLKHLYLTSVKVEEECKPKNKVALRLGEPLAQPQLPVFKNLKILTCDNRFPDSVIYQILESSPNLSEIILHHEIVPCLIKPTNRLQFLKILVICDYEEDKTATLELIVKNSLQNNLEVQQIQIGGFDEFFEAPSQNIVDAVRKISEGCSGTFKKLALATLMDNFYFGDSLIFIKSNMLLLNSSISCMNNS